ncbi:MAG: DUF2807 domain-containing protein [Bacteroidetes bacterium]|nr:DUF2807 domain-containing protein [Bacteroidota bacterium]
MKTTNLLFGLLILTTVISSCSKNDEFVTPSGNITSVTKEIGNYNTLDVSDAFNAYVTFSTESENVRIEANSNLQSLIYCEKQGDRLVISLDDGVQVRKVETVLNVYITANHIDEFMAAGATRIQLENELQSEAVKISLSGGCHFSGMLYSGEVDAILYGASSLDIIGESSYFDITAVGASIMNGYGFSADHLNADLEGASKISLTVHESLRVEAIGASKVRYKGEGLIEKQILSGASQIIKM